MKREEHEKPEHAGPSGTWKESEIMDFGEDTPVCFQIYPNQTSRIHVISTSSAQRIFE